MDSITLKLRTFCQEYLAFKDRWSLMAVVSQDSFQCIVILSDDKDYLPTLTAQQQISVHATVNTAPFPKILTTYAIHQILLVYIYIEMLRMHTCLSDKTS